MKINWYTSYYQKMSTRAKQDNDFYIQVSRSIVCYAKDKNGNFISQIIDTPELGELVGNYSDSLEDYYKQLDDYKDDIKEFFNEILKGINDNEKEVFNELDKTFIEGYGKKFLELTDEEYTKFIQEDEELTDDEKNEIKTKEDFINKYLCMNIFLLCHENLESKYTKKDEEKYNGEVKAGEYKQCHRRVLAKWLKDNLNLDVKEWNINKENESIVYRNYF